MTDKNYMKRRFKCRCYQKDNTVKIYDGSEILFDVSYRDFDDAFYLGRKLQSVIMELNKLHEENTNLRKEKECDKQVFTKKQLHELLQQTRKENEQLKETNQELYDFRLVLNALLFNEWVKNGKYEVYKSKRHHDGSIPFPDDNEDWFIVVAILPSGQVTNHYHIKYWDYFKIPSYPKVKDEFDGHTSSVVLLRYGGLLE